MADLPEPAPEQSVDNGPNIVPRPANAWPIAPKGFKVELYATGLDNPRLIRFAPNGDLFLAESETGKIKVFRGVDATASRNRPRSSPTGLHQPFGIAFYPSGDHPQWVYIGDTDAIVRFPYHNGDLTASGPMEHIADLPGGGRLRGGGHWTRDLAFSQDGSKLFASVGSHSNVDDSDTHPEEFHRADVLEFTPEGKFLEDLRLGPSQLRGRGHQSHDGRALVLDQRARRPGQQPCARLHHARSGRRFLRLAVVVHGPASGPAPRGQASRAQRQGHHARHSARAPLRLAGDDVLRRARSSPPNTRATSSPPSTAPGTAPSAPATK